MRREHRYYVYICRVHRAELCTLAWPTISIGEFGSTKLMP